MPVINDPAICAEVAALHDAYELALAANDVRSLGEFFWSAAEVVRFGVAEHLYGAEAISAYRQTHKVVFSNRKTLRRTIVAVGADAASVMCEISQTISGQPRHSRQSQVWVRFPEVGWKIIAAHVSNAFVPSPVSWGTYADQASAAVGLPLAAAHRPGVAATLSRIAAVAGPLLDFALPDHPEPASVFTA